MQDMIWENVTQEKTSNGEVAKWKPKDIKSVAIVKLMSSLKKKKNHNTNNMRQQYPMEVIWRFYTISYRLALKTEIMQN